ncbi:MAG: alpha/beta hydrolase [Litoreibacter sp.]|nr:alpha/beta hydrolase [Litoreibacter sp.]MCY4336658.1 alpha/beta hydrolase [Litoreibacter sp.]
MTSECKPITHRLTVEHTALEVSALRRDGDKAPIVFLHGFGSTKEDYADIQRHASFDGHRLLMYDAPGCGRTECGDLSRVTIPFLVKTARAMLDAEGIDRFHLVGHSMGGLTALKLAGESPDQVLSFCNIEGNIAPEDCFLSRQIHDYPANDAQSFMTDFIERASKAPAWSSPLYASSLAHKVRSEAVWGIFTSMVDLSDNAGLMDRFLNLPCPKMFMYGDQNAYLTYLHHIEANAVELAEIPQCGHFPMYANPLAMWLRLGEFVARSKLVD